MVGFNNLINPVYHPKTSIEEIDGKTLFVIWCPAGMERPYEVPDDVTVKEKKYNYRVRYNSSSIIPKGQMKTELLELASNIPFDDRPNMTASINDISKTLVRDFLVKTGSKLADQIETEPFQSVLEAMDLLVGPKEAPHPKNVALLMFNEHPEKFFPYTQVDITIFPKGKLRDPDNFIEVPSIKGPIDSIYNKTMPTCRQMSSRRTFRKSRISLKPNGPSTIPFMPWRRLSGTASIIMTIGNGNRSPLRLNQMRCTSAIRVARIVP